MRQDTLFWHDTCQVVPPAAPPRLFLAQNLRPLLPANRSLILPDAEAFLFYPGAMIIYDGVKAFMRNVGLYEDYGATSHHLDTLDKVATVVRTRSSFRMAAAAAEGAQRDVGAADCGGLAGVAEAGARARVAAGPYSAEEPDRLFAPNILYLAVLVAAQMRQRKLNHDHTPRPIASPPPLSP